MSIIYYVLWPAKPKHNFKNTNVFNIACFQVHKYTKFGKGINNIRNSLHSSQRAAFYNVFVHDCTN